MAKLNEIEADLDGEMNGVWIPFVLDIEVLIARARAPKFLEALRKIKKRARAQNLDVEQMIEEDPKMMAPLVARHILKGWKNLDGEDGSPIEFSEEKALEILLNPKYIDFYIFVIRESNNAAIFANRKKQEAAGN